MIRSASVSAVAVALLTSAPACAQDAKAPDVAAAMNSAGAGIRAAEAAALMSKGSPDDRALAGFVAPHVSFSTADDETTVSLAFSFDLSSSEPHPTGDEGADGAQYYRVSQSKLSLVATAPIDGEQDALPRLFSGDSLINGAKIKLSFSNITNTLGNAKGAGKFIAPAFERCIEEQAAAWLASHPTPGMTADLYLQSIPPGARTAYEGYLLRNAQGKEPGTLDYEVYHRCAPGGDETFRFDDDGQLVDAYTEFGKDFTSRFYDDRSSMFFWGFDASVGQDKYAYLDSAAFENADVSKTSWEAGGYLGLINWNSTFSVRARALYGTTWKLPEESETCQTFGNPPEEHCLKGPDGPPEKFESGLFSLEARHLIALNDTTRIAIAPQVTYRLEDDVFGVEVPVYLSPDEDGKLTGGLKFAYTSKGDEFGVGVFVGIPFSIFFD